MLKFNSQSIIMMGLILSMANLGNSSSTLAQPIPQQATTSSSIDGNFNNVLQIPNQNNNDNSNQVNNSADNNNVNEQHNQNSNDNYNQVSNNVENQNVNDSHNSNQNATNVNNTNVNEFNYPEVTPLDNPIYTPVNTENDFGLNLSVGMNTLNSANVTVYLGVIYQPGRTSSHVARMNQLAKQTELLEAQTENLRKQTELLESQRQLLETQIGEAQLRLKGLQNSP